MSTINPVPLTIRLLIIFLFLFFYSVKKVHCTVIIEFETKSQATYLFPILGYNKVEVSMQRLVGN